MLEKQKKRLTLSLIYLAYSFELLSNSFIKINQDDKI